MKVAWNKPPSDHPNHNGNGVNEPTDAHGPDVSGRRKLITRSPDANVAQDEAEEEHIPADERQPLARETESESQRS